MRRRLAQNVSDIYFTFKRKPLGPTVEGFYMHGPRERNDALRVRLNPDRNPELVRILKVDRRAGTHDTV